METKQLNVELNWTHCGQYHAYGDTYRVCEVHTDNVLDEPTILSLVNNGGKLPKGMWDSQTGDIGVYFAGWYTITKTDYGYKYIGCEPYTD